MQTKQLLFGAACALLLVPGGVVRADDKPVTLARTVKVGDAVREKVTVNASVMGMDIVVVQTAKTTAKEIDKKGQVIWVQTSEPSKITVGGQEQEQPATPPITETRDKYNKLVDFKPAEGGQDFMSAEVQKMTAMASQIIMPEKPVKADDSWTTEFDNPLVKEKKVTVKTTFVGTDKVDGKEYWKIKQTANGVTDKDGAKMTSDMTAWLDPADGSMFKMEGKVNDIPTQVGPLSWTMKLERLKLEKTEKTDKAA
jgi:hypothetical protein